MFKRIKESIIQYLSRYSNKFKILSSMATVALLLVGTVFLITMLEVIGSVILIIVSFMIFVILYGMIKFLYRNTKEIFDTDKTTQTV